MPLLPAKAFLLLGTLSRILFSKIESVSEALLAALFHEIMIRENI